MKVTSYLAGKRKGRQSNCTAVRKQVCIHTHTNDDIQLAFLSNNISVGIQTTVCWYIYTGWGLVCSKTVFDTPHQCLGSMILVFMLCICMRIYICVCYASLTCIRMMGICYHKPFMACMRLHAVCYNIFAIPIKRAEAGRESSGWAWARARACAQRGQRSNSSRSSLICALSPPQHRASLNLSHASCRAFPVQLRPLDSDIIIALCLCVLDPGPGPGPKSPF